MHCDLCKRWIVCWQANLQWTKERALALNTNTMCYEDTMICLWFNQMFNLAFWILVAIHLKRTQNKKEKQQHLLSSYSADERHFPFHSNSLALQIHMYHMYHMRTSFRYEHRKSGSQACIASSSKRAHDSILTPVFYTMDSVWFKFQIWNEWSESDLKDFTYGISI